MKLPDWLDNNKAIVIVAVVCVTLIVIVFLLRPPRYQKAGPEDRLILDTHTGKMLRMDGTPVKLPVYKK